MHLGRRLCRKTARGKTPYSSSTIAPSSLEHDGSYLASESSREKSPRPSRKRSPTEASLDDDDLEDDEEAEPPDDLEDDEEDRWRLEQIFDWMEEGDSFVIGSATPDISALPPFFCAHCSGICAYSHISLIHLYCDAT